MKKAKSFGSAFCFGESSFARDFSGLATKDRVELELEAECARLAEKNLEATENRQTSGLGRFRSREMWASLSSCLSFR